MFDKGRQPGYLIRFVKGRDFCLAKNGVHVSLVAFALKNLGAREMHLGALNLTRDKGAQLADARVRCCHGGVSTNPCSGCDAGKAGGYHPEEEGSG